MSKEEQSKKENPKENVKYIKDIIWIDRKVNDKQNQKYQKIIKEKILDMNLKVFDNFEKGFDEIKNYKKQFKFIYLILSGIYFQDYVKNFYSNREKLKIIPITIIFTSKKYIDYLLGKKEDKQYPLTEKTLKSIRNPLYNFGHITSKFQDILDFINNFENYFNENEKKENIENFKKVDESELIFERIYSIENLVLPSLYNHLEIQNLDILKTDIDKMNNHIISKYPKKDIIQILLPLKKFNVNITPEIMSRIWVYIYSCESNFYRDMNKNLRLQKDTILYKSFIKMLYKGLSVKTLKMNCKDNLYRCCFIKKEEIKKLEEIIYIPPKIESKETDKIDVCLIYSRSFLSFSKNKDQALKFLRENTNNEDYSCILEVNGLQGEIDENEFFSSNAEIWDISRIPKEEEVLFFPFSSFIITDIDDGKEEKGEKDKKQIINVK